MYFCRRGVESIVDDEVTKRFSAQELESWNLLTRSNFNARHISLRLSVLWGLGLFIRYGFLLPLRSEVKSQGQHLRQETSLLVIGQQGAVVDIKMSTNEIYENCVYLA